MEKVLILLRGVPGAGKTTITRLLFPEAKAFAADDFMLNEDSGDYEFKADRLGYAPKRCVDGVELAMQMQHPMVVVHNTLTTEREIRPYAEFADKYGYKLVSFIVENRHGNSNVHGVADEKLKQMADRLRQSIRLLPGSPDPVLGI